MPRAPRIEFAGAIYHVMSRGNHLEPIVQDEADRALWMKTLGEACEGAGWRIHAFVLMRNHYHLLLETVRANLVRGMQIFNATYTRRYNVRHRTYGHLFQGRYKALLVDPEAEGYFLTVSDYVHLNPVRAGLVGDLAGLRANPWSSAGWLSGMRRNMPGWLDWRRVYGELGMDRWRSVSRREYRQHLGRRLAEARERRQKREGDAYEKIRRGWCYGGEEFLGRMKARLEDLTKEKVAEERWNDEAAWEAEEERAGRLMRQALAAWGKSHLAELETWERYLLARWLRGQTRATVGWLAQQMQIRTRGGMSTGIYWAGKQIEANRRLTKRWTQLSALTHTN